MNLLEEVALCTQPREPPFRIRPLLTPLARDDWPATFRYYRSLRQSLDVFLSQGASLISRLNDSLCRRDPDLKCVAANASSLRSLASSIPWNHMVSLCDQLAAASLQEGSAAFNIYGPFWEAAHLYERFHYRLNLLRTLVYKVPGALDTAPSPPLPHPSSSEKPDRRQLITSLRQAIRQCQDKPTKERLMDEMEYVSGQHLTLDRQIKLHMGPFLMAEKEPPLHELCTLEFFSPSLESYTPQFFRSVRSFVDEGDPLFRRLYESLRRWDPDLNAVAADANALGRLAKSIPWDEMADLFDILEAASLQGKAALEIHGPFWKVCSIYRRYRRSVWKLGAQVSFSPERKFLPSPPFVLQTLSVAFVLQS
ncbi:hypothetical protein MLD38_039147 [Melastoma candidum]|uniref:Uncharacterized protein n=1 Tax=Melastoma candidum TaxID=119954 RepID=A0ACB9L2D1_9MYRT|nr:hypothetical protein MLD38_039147 [Melastoma candidum]